MCQLLAVQFKLFLIAEYVFYIRRAENNTDMNLEKYRTVFCDSKEALDGARKKGLPSDAIIYSSSPALLYDNKNNKYIRNIENNWSKNELDQFHTSIEEFVKKVFNLTIKANNRDYSLIVGNTILKFQRLIYSAACLKERDIIGDILFIKVDTSNNVINLDNINAPWDKLLEGSKFFNVFNYKLKDVNCALATEKDIPFYKRMYVAGFETAIFRLMSLKSIDIIRALICKFFKCREILIPSDNELLIETSYNLIKKGVFIKNISIGKFSKSDNIYTNEINSTLSDIEEALRCRLKKWVMPSLIDRCVDIFSIQLESSLKQVSNYKKGWENVILESKNIKSLLFINAPSNLSGIALTSLCRKLNIPIVSFQHGVSQEICETHSDMAIHYESNYSDITISYNNKASEVYNNSYFYPQEQKSISVGMSNRHFRMKAKSLYKNSIPIIYVSTNLYKGNTGFFIDRLSDYDSAINESNLISKVFSKIPHKMSYKPYPEVNRRYVDDDPILKEILETDNISLFRGKVDMRYSISKYKILITSKATSTLSWLIMSGKPTIFINWKENMALTDEAYPYFEKGLFLFNPDSDGFDIILEFLSKPLSEIESLWEEKLKYRDEMIKLFFSSHKNDSGKRAANYIYNFFKC
jgi:CRISPR/Cas system-associated exonuclease Cas4 (RecB family)